MESRPTYGWCHLFIQSDLSYRALFLIVYLYMKYVITSLVKCQDSRHHKVWAVLSAKVKITNSITLLLFFLMKNDFLHYNQRNLISFQRSGFTNPQKKWTARLSKWLFQHRHLLPPQFHTTKILVNPFLTLQSTV